ncbi:hypothetical protein DES53_115132 [Roseimicrobium gellanilyticum]|uniref:Uncharacterized protein n=1 Tax=Roseimicrobium gellanilyticum TaxID=748857 RepID=A0A366H6A7_9BACT|nr:hypothetical protein [Roseimicrobium gellanilyticum]RBP36991.1 hypothetical protein DES53_115132 [Roseimicrobium gellanilyticum]
MSRRTKLIILGLFLVLLAIPAIYVALTWRISRPVHFRLMHLYPEEHQDEFGFRMVRMRVENTNSMPIHVYFVRLEFTGDTPELTMIPPGTIDPRHQKEAGTHAEAGAFILPPGRAILATASLQANLVKEAKQGRLSANYYALSQTQKQVSSVFNWLHDLCPAPWWSKFPTFEFPSGSAPVEVDAAFK